MRVALLKCIFPNFHMLSDFFFCTSTADCSKKKKHLKSNKKEKMILCVEDLFPLYLERGIKNPFFILVLY